MRVVGQLQRRGVYFDSSGNGHAFVVNEVGGVWRTAKKIAGTAAFNAGSGAQIWSLSCTSASNCSAGGFYFDSSGHRQAFVVNEVGGTWDNAEEVPGTAALNGGGQALILSVSCVSAGNCSAGGSYSDNSGNGQAFVANEVRGVWRTAIEVPGAAALNAGGYARVLSGRCSAGHCLRTSTRSPGRYTPSRPIHRFQALLALLLTCPQFRRPRPGPPR